MKLELAASLESKPVVSRRAIRKSFVAHAVFAAVLSVWITIAPPAQRLAPPSPDVDAWEPIPPRLIEVPGTPSCETRWEQLRDGRVLEVAPVLLEDRAPSSCETEPAALYWAPAVSAFHPRHAIGEGVAGRVWVSLLVDRHGRVAQAEPVADLNPGWEFAAAALAAVRDRRYRPLKIDGRAVASRFTDVVDFGPSVGEGDRR